MMRTFPLRMQDEIVKELRNITGKRPLVREELAASKNNFNNIANSFSL